MELVALTLVKIDGDVIEEFVRHTLQFADRVIVADNASLDATPQILQALQREGLPVQVWPIEMIAERASLTSELARRAFEETACDYLLLLDADEFVNAASRAALESALAALPQGAHALVPWTTYVPTREDDAAQARVLLRLRYRRRVESAPYSKLFVSRSFAAHPESTIAAGNHYVENDSGGTPPVTLDRVKLAHFPVRSIGQIQSKALLGWTQYLASGFDREGEIAYQWRRLYDRLRRDPHWTRDDLLDAAWHYLDTEREDPDVVFDPLPPVACRYSVSEPNAFEVAMSYTRQLAKAYAAVSGADRGTT